VVGVDPAFQSREEMLTGAAGDGVAVEEELGTVGIDDRGR